LQYFETAEAVESLVINTVNKERKEGRKKKRNKEGRR
jgi:hypothetical protein